MNEIFPLASAAGMTVGLAVCALVIGSGPGDALCGTGVSEMAPGSLACNRHSDHPARATGNSGGAVYLFRLFQLLLTLSDGFTIPLGFTQIPVQMQIENFDVSPFLCGRSRCRCCTPLTPRKRCAALKAVPAGPVGVRPGAGVVESGHILPSGDAADVAPCPARPR